MATATNRWIKNDQEHKIRYALIKICKGPDLARFGQMLWLQVTFHILIPLLYFFCHSKWFPVFPVLNQYNLFHCMKVL